MARFSVKPLRWEPYLPPVDVAVATAAQLAAMQVTPSGIKISPYVRTLAHDPQSYIARTQLYNHIMYAKEGLAQHDRELVALVTSLINGCVYCASVHARKYISLTDRGDIVQELYVHGIGGTFDTRIKALIDFCYHLAVSPVKIDEKSGESLKNHGFTCSEIVDVIKTVAIFSMANRLMHTLGHARSAQDRA
ncbi:peroxidase-related enzyme [Acetobacter tropicalis]|uniref:Alkylhydroperoxidase n=1 Tax=Acetobacter tropicalis TaxID=104102 RepID=A0A252A5V5_9PROT|nr:peroxidase-related enzyme [Acetobacter tropicalis]OUI84958.1 alkylhydroperoxidase [Acetobacter tropicalis]